MKIDSENHLLVTDCVKQALAVTRRGCDELIPEDDWVRKLARSERSGVPLRIKLARGASRTLRGILVRDLNQSVARAALNGSAMSEDELEQIASSRAVIDVEVLA